MALKLSTGPELIEVILYLDDSVNCDRETYDEYLNDLDESKLQLTEGTEPTRFVLRKVLPLKFAQMIKKEQAVIRNQGVEFNIAYMMTEVQCALVDIKNAPEGLAYRRNKDGIAHDSIIEILESLGVINDLFLARQRSMQSNKSDPKKS